MKLFIDDANTREIRRLCDIYPIDGVTTNPTILARAGGRPAEVLKEIRAIIGGDRLLFAQAIPMDAEGMIRDAHAIISLLGGNTIVKVPAIPEGFRAIKRLAEEGIRTCGTVVYTPMQAYLAAKAGAEYVAPYVNRIDNMGYDGVGVVKQIQDILTRHGMPAKILAASFKNSQQVLTLCAYGIPAATCAPAVIDAFVKNPAIDEAAAAFVRDFEKLAGEGAAMADLIG
ncbi:MAG: fructose-6-phosphate aldolase [Clostridia bacterium]|nr:fructose-6-phosphate aldolase [Clostridia bacterium]